MHRKRTVHVQVIYMVILVRKEIENITMKHNTRLKDHVNSKTLSVADPIGLEPRLRKRKTSDIVRNSLPA